MSDSPVFFDVYQAYEHDGVSIKGPQMNPETLTQKDQFDFIAENDSKLYVEVFNEKGEVQNYVLSPWIVPKPDQECETSVECPPPEEAETDDYGNESTEEETSDDAPGGEGGRRLQNPQSRLD